MLETLEATTEALKCCICPSGLEMVQECDHRHCSTSVAVERQQPELQQPEQDLQQIEACAAVAAALVGEGVDQDGDHPLGLEVELPACVGAVPALVAIASRQCAGLTGPIYRSSS